VYGVDWDLMILFGPRLVCRPVTGDLSCYAGSRRRSSYSRPGIGGWVFRVMSSVVVIV